VIPHTEGDLVHVIRAIEAELSVIFFEVKSHMIEFPFSKYSHISSHKVPKADLRVQPKLRARLRSFKSSGNAFNVAEKDSWANSHVGL
jgi:hypothetical protein